MADLPIVRNAIRLGALGPTGWLDLVQAAFELAIARWNFGTKDIATLVANDSTLESLPSARCSEADRRLLHRVHYAIPRVGNRLPWRADCLIQAMAAKRWLARRGIPTALNVGVRRNGSVPFEAHAWLTVGDFVVTGGDISGFTLLVGSDIAEVDRVP